MVCIQRLISLAVLKNGESHVESVLKDLSEGIEYSLTLEKFDRDLHTIQSSGIPPHLAALFYRRLWADQFLAPVPGAEIRDCLAQHCSWATVLEADLENPWAGHWVKIPILLARNQSTRVVWFIAGLVPSASCDLFIPPWALKLMDTRFQESIRCAEQRARHTCRDMSDRRFVVFPLSVDSGMKQFIGGSATLALGLGMKSLVNDQPVSPDVIATGCLDSNGWVTPVGNLNQKVNGALEQRFKCFLYPAQTAPSLALSRQPGRQMAFYAVSRFDMAWTLASLYSDQHASLLHDFVMALDDAGQFIDKMASFLREWLNLQEAAVRNLLTDIFADMGQFGRFADRFFAMTRKFSLHQTASTLAKLAPDTVPGQWPMAALTWCTANLALANHQGQITQARIWEQQGKDTAEKCMCLDPDKVAEFFNTLLVNAHNRFEFKMNLPGPLPDLLALLEKRHGVMSESGCVIDQTLGRLYGSLVQNAAFCGPDHIKKIEEWSDKARKALGENIAPELKPEWMRQYSYLGLARLCAKNIDGAQHCLCKYLGVKNTEKIVSKKHKDLDPWQTAILCRFLATGGISVPDKFYTRLVSHVKENAQFDHPWQLTCFNLGRAAVIRDDKKNATSLFEQSRNICLTPLFGPTIGIMALKPLAFVQPLVPAHEFGAHIPSWEVQIKKASQQLNQDHFFFLHDRDFHGALAHVRENHDSIFPFSYG